MILFFASKRLRAWVKILVGGFDSQGPNARPLKITCVELPFTFCIWLARVIRRDRARNHTQLLILIFAWRRDLHKRVRVRALVLGHHRLLRLRGGRQRYACRHHRLSAYMVAVSAVPVIAIASSA